MTETECVVVGWIHMAQDRSGELRKVLRLKCMKFAEGIICETYTLKGICWSF